MSTDKTQDVFEEVKLQVEKIGALTTENIDEMQKSVKKLHDELDDNTRSIDALKGLKIDRFAEDAATRQEAVDKAITETKTNQESLQKHLEQIDMLMQRHQETSGDSKEVNAEMKNFVLSVKALNNSKETIEDLTNIFPEYAKTFDKFLRTPGDERNLTSEQMKALSVGSDLDGGFAVTPFMSNKVIERLYETSPIRELANVESISTDAFEQMVDWDDTTTVGWESETIAGAKTDTPKMQKLRIPVHVMYAKSLATQQLLEDAAINVEAWLANKTGEKMGRTEATAFIEGDGIGKPRGLLTYADGTTRGTIEQVAMENANLLTTDGFVSIKYSLIEQFLNRGTWLMNRTSVAAAMKLKGGDGYYIWKPSMIAGDPFSTILGSPVRMATDMPEVAANALAVIYADFNAAYTIVDRLGISVQRDPYTQKPFVEFYFRKRLGGDVVNSQAIKIGKISA